MTAAWARALGGVAILIVLGWQIGTGPFLDGVRLIDAPTLSAALAIGLLSTVCAAWRWTLVAAGLGIRLPLREATEAYYRAQFLNTTLPGGVVGDVHRALRHGSQLGDVGLGIRAVVLERIGGHIVQIALGMVVLLALPSPVRDHLPLPAIVVGVICAGLAAAWLVRRQKLRFTAATWAGVIATSAIVLFGQLVVFLLAARTSGATAPLAVLAPLTLFALLAMAVPLSFAGWGPREGAAAWAFAAAGLTAAQGLTTAVTYGVLALVASLPGAAVLIARWLRREPVAVANG
jgi:uncharacterized membrane protein YbhN (UPF0104 family)